MPILTILLIALIPVWVLFLLPFFSDTIEQRRASASLKFFMTFVWAFALYLAFTVGFSDGYIGHKVLFFILGGPTYLTYRLFFKTTSVQAATTPKNDSSMPH
jgi:hypothetical protein